MKPIKYYTCDLALGSTFNHEAYTADLAFSRENSRNVRPGIKVAVLLAGAPAPVQFEFSNAEVDVTAKFSALQLLEKMDLDDKLQLSLPTQGLKGWLGELRHRKKLKAMGYRLACELKALTSTATFTVANAPKSKVEAVKVSMAVLALIGAGAYTSA